MVINYTNCPYCRLFSTALLLTLIHQAIQGSKTPAGFILQTPHNIFNFHFLLRKKHSTQKKHLHSPQQDKIKSKQLSCLTSSFQKWLLRLVHKWQQGIILRLVQYLILLRHVAESQKKPPSWSLHRRKLTHMFVPGWDSSFKFYEWRPSQF